MVMAVTSNHLSVRKLGGKRWKQIQRGVYVVQFLLFGHVLLIEKADVLKYTLWLGSLALLQIVRWTIKYRRQT